MKDIHQPRIPMSVSFDGRVTWLRDARGFSYAATTAEGDADFLKAIATAVNVKMSARQAAEDACERYAELANAWPTTEAGAVAKDLRAVIRRLLEQ